jgi:carboxymethylenebutenolidase
MDITSRSSFYMFGNHVNRYYFARPTRGEHPGILLLHSWWGLTPAYQRICENLAEKGFAVFAPDLNLGKVAEDIPTAEKIMAERDYALLSELTQDAVSRLGVQPGVLPTAKGVVGFSMGASWALVLAAQFPADFQAVVLFYGVEGVDFSRLQAAVQGHYGESDTWTKLDWSRQMEADLRCAGRETEFYAYPGAGHWFCEVDQPAAYQPEAADLAWERAHTFLHRRLRNI